MPKRSSKRPQGEDVNEVAFRVVQEATGGVKPKQPEPEKNPAAVALGRLGGKKGGPARAKKLSAKRRKEIARGAAAKRWRKDKA